MRKLNVWGKILCAVIICACVVIIGYLNTHNTVKATVYSVRNGFVTLETINGELYEIEVDSKSELELYDHVKMVINQNGEVIDIKFDK